MQRHARCCRGYATCWHAALAVALDQTKSLRTRSLRGNRGAQAGHLEPGLSGGAQPAVAERDGDFRVVDCQRNGIVRLGFGRAEIGLVLIAHRRVRLRSDRLVY